jgi:hypothetical protein
MKTQIPTITERMLLEKEMLETKINYIRHNTVSDDDNLARASMIESLLALYDILDGKKKT